VCGYIYCRNKLMLVYDEHIILTNESFILINMMFLNFNISINMMFLNFKPLKTEFLPHNIYKFSSYLTGNITSLQSQPVNAVWGNSCCLL
jgi:hypothetical protein